jgi:hypothetical protein
MPVDNRKPGVYVDETLFAGSSGTSAATTVTLFVGAARTGPSVFPVRCNTWSDYVLNFGGFEAFSDPDDATASITSYLPYSVYTYFQNGGRPAYVQRAIGAGGESASYEVPSGSTSTASVTASVAVDGVATLTTDGAHGFQVGDIVEITNVGIDYDGTVTITGVTSTTFSYATSGGSISSESGIDGSATSSSQVSFAVTAISVGTPGNNISVAITVTDSGVGVFNMSVYVDGVETERFQHLTAFQDGPAGTRNVESTVNDPYSGSNIVRVSDVNPLLTPNALSPINLTGGIDPSLPESGDFVDAAVDGASKIEGPILISQVGFLSKSSTESVIVSPSPLSSSNFLNRSDVFIINDSVDPRAFNQSSSSYKSLISSTLTQFTGDSYVAAYTPWIIIPDPRRSGSTITIPPGGAVAGVMSRVDSTIGVFRAPAGVVAAISNAIGVDTRYTDAELGDLNAANINVIRPVPGVGVAIMGARTRRLYGADRYVSGRRTLIYLKETLRQSTSFALFENNDRALWRRLEVAAERILLPLWEAGGLRGATASQAYFIKCDDTINTPAVMESGEVRMEVGVALEYPAEFIVIKVTQFESGGITAEVQPRG